MEYSEGRLEHTVSAEFAWEMTAVVAAASRTVNPITAKRAIATILLNKLRENILNSFGCLISRFEYSAFDVQNVAFEFLPLLPFPTKILQITYIHAILLLYGQQSHFFERN
jgi:hypothetical protein